MVAAVEALSDEYHEKYGLGDHKRSYIADELFADLLNAETTPMKLRP